ncbi:unnamed protein product, partial [Dibothriocephalus latus]
MRSSSEISNGTRLDRGTLLSSSLRDQTAPRTTTATGAANSVRLNPDDFLTREQKLWNLRPAPLKTLEDSTPRIAVSTGALSSAELVRAPKAPQAITDPTTSSNPRPTPRLSNRKSPQDCLVRINGDTHIIPDPQELRAKEVPKGTSAESSIKMADCDATDSEAFDAQIGWWPSVPSAAKSERGSLSSAECIALAAGHFDVNE